MTFPIPHGTGYAMPKNPHMKFVFLLLLSFAVHAVQAQGFAVNATGANAHSSAMLDVSSNSKGVLVSRMTSVQRTAIATPATGLLVFDTDSVQFAFYNGTAWQMLSSSANFWVQNGTHQYSNVPGNVGIGINNPLSKLHVKGALRVDSGRINITNTGQSVFIGDNAGGNDNFANSRSVAVGRSALAANSSAAGNVALGFEALKSATTANNTAIGFQSLNTNFLGNSNTAVGASSGSLNISGSRNSILGYQSLYNSLNGSNNVAIGADNLYSNTTGSNNVSVGYNAGYNNTGSSNIFLGANAGANETGSNKLYIDNSNTAAPLIYGDFSNDSLKINGKVHVAGNMKIDGGRLPFVNTGQSVFIGENAGANDDLTTNQNVFIGYDAGKANTTGTGGTFIGHNAGKANTTGYANAFIGRDAGTANTTGTWNNAFGESALTSNTTGNHNVALGRAALGSNTTASSNIGIGRNALSFNTAGNENTVVGDLSMWLNNGSGNVTLGAAAGANTNNASSNTFIGYSSGYNNNGNANVFLGYQSGHNETGSNKLYIDNSSTTSPLLYGNFAADSLKVNGTLTVNNAYTFPNTSGTANQILQTNGAGQASWVNASSLSISEADPKVATTTNNIVPKWNGTALTNGIITDNGTNVGIGTTTPSTRLHITSDNSVSNTTIESGSQQYPTALTILPSTHTNSRRSTIKLDDWQVLQDFTGTGTKDFSIYQGATGQQRITINTAGNVGVGTTAPSQAKLVVSGSANNTLTYGYLNSSGITGTNGPVTQDYSIHATSRIAATEFNAFSDARIKNIKGKTDNAQDLNTLMGIEITNYTLKDVIGKGTHAYKKVIAQQVEKVFPQAVSSMTDVIPDIYQQADMKAGNITLASTLKAGDRVKLIYDKKEEVFTVNDANASSFSVNSTYTGKVFVYGREVNDFRSVDYEAISMLNVSATQELQKQVRQQNVTISKQQAQIEWLMQQVKALQQQQAVTTKKD
jgi:hypothetical protein